MARRSSSHGRSKKNDEWPQGENIEQVTEQDEDLIRRLLVRETKARTLIKDLRLALKKAIKEYDELMNDMQVLIQTCERLNYQNASLREENEVFKQAHHTVTITIQSLLKEVEMKEARWSQDIRKKEKEWNHERQRLYQEIDRLENFKNQDDMVLSWQESGIQSAESELPNFEDRRIYENKKYDKRYKTDINSKIRRQTSSTEEAGSMVVLTTKDKWMVQAADNTTTDSFFTRSNDASSITNKNTNDDIVSQAGDGTNKVDSSSIATSAAAVISTPPNSSQPRKNKQVFLPQESQNSVESPYTINIINSSDGNIHEDVYYNEEQNKTEQEKCKTENEQYKTEHENEEQLKVHGNDNQVESVDYTPFLAFDLKIFPAENRKIQREDIEKGMLEEKKSVVQQCFDDVRAFIASRPCILEDTAAVISSGETKKEIEAEISQTKKPFDSIGDSGGHATRTDSLRISENDFETVDEPPDDEPKLVNDEEAIRIPSSPQHSRGKHHKSSAFSNLTSSLVGMLKFTSKNKKPKEVAIALSPKSMRPTETLYSQDMDAGPTAEEHQTRSKHETLEATQNKVKRSAEISVRTLEENRHNLRHKLKKTGNNMSSSDELCARGQTPGMFEESNFTEVARSIKHTKKKDEPVFPISENLHEKDETLRIDKNRDTKHRIKSKLTTSVPVIDSEKTEVHRKSKKPAVVSALSEHDLQEKSTGLNFNSNEIETHAAIRSSRKKIDLAQLLYK